MLIRAACTHIHTWIWSTGIWYCGNAADSGNGGDDDGDDGDDDDGKGDDL